MSTAKIRAHTCTNKTSVCSRFIGPTELAAWRVSKFKGMVECLIVRRPWSKHGPRIKWYKNPREWCEWWVEREWLVAMPWWHQRLHKFLTSPHDDMALLSQRWPVPRGRARPHQVLKARGEGGDDDIDWGCWDNSTRVSHALAIYVLQEVRFPIL